MKPARIAAALAGLLASAACGPALASTYRIDDTGSYASQAVTPMRWRQPVPGRASDNTVEGRVNVALRLHLAPWINRPARIYMVLAPTEGRQLTASWRTQGRLLPGTLRGSGRAPVFDGVVRDAYLLENIVLDLSTDGRTLDRPQSLQFTFEIEVSP